MKVINKNLLNLNINETGVIGNHIHQICQKKILMILVNGYLIKMQNSNFKNRGENNDNR